MFKQLLFISIIFFNIIHFSTEPIYSQEKEGEIIIISERVGEVIDLEERNIYKLWSVIENFQSAVALKLSDGSYVFKITYLDKTTGEEKVRRVSINELEIKKIGEYIDNFEKTKEEKKKIKLAQMREALLEAITHLKYGNVVRVHSLTLDIIEGKFLKISNETFILKTDRTEKSMPISEIDALWVKGNQAGTMASAGALLFGLSSFALGVVSCEVKSSGGCRDWDKVCGSSLIGAGIGALFGAGIGLSTPKWQLVFPQ